MRILIACEYSGIVREAFKSQGHDAMSCDLLPTEQPGNHYQGDVFDIIGDGWDMMIAHPPCTYLSYAGIAHWNKPGREEKRKAALKFMIDLFESPIERICIENPLGWASQAWRKPNQIIHPFYFGENHMKRTCLWLKGLQPLMWFERENLFSLPVACKKPEPIYIDNTSRKKKRYFTDACHGGHSRSKSFQSIADAMAAQWGKLW